MSARFRPISRHLLCALLSSLALWTVAAVGWAADTAPAPAAPAEPAQVWDTLPDSAWVILSVPDVDHARKAFKAGKLNALGNLPGIRDFVADVAGFYQKGIDDGVTNNNLGPWMKALHIDPKKLLDVPAGEFTFAIVQFSPIDAHFDLVLRMGVGAQEQATGFGDLIDQVIAMRPDLPLQKRDMKFGKQQAMALEIPELNVGAYFSTDDKTIRIGTDPDRFGRMLDHGPLALDKETALKDSALGKSLVKTLKGNPDLLLYFNFSTMTADKVQDPGQQRFIAGAERLGVRKLAYALRFDDESGNVLETVLVDYDPQAWKVDGAVAQAVDLSTFEHGPGGTVAQVTLNLNWAQTWKVLNTFLRQGGDAAEREKVVAGLEEFFGMKIPDLLACLDGQVTANVSLPRTRTGFLANVIPDGTLKFGLADAAKAEAAVGKFHDWFAANAQANKQFTAEPIKVEGARAAWTYAPPGRHNPLKPVLIIEEKNLYFAPMGTMAAHARRATPYGPQLAEREDWQQLKPGIDPNAFLVAYLDLATAAELGYNFGTYAATMAPTNPFEKYQLPQGDQVGKLFTGWLITAHTEGTVVVVRSQSPVGFVPGVAVTGFLAKYFEVSERTQRLLARRDMAGKRLTALYDACSRFNAANKKLPGKLSELYPDQLKNIADFTVGDQAWSMNPQGNGDRLRALIDDRTEFVFVPANFGAADKPFLVPKQVALEADQGMPVVNGDGKSVMLNADEYAALLDKIPDAAGGNNPPPRGWRGRGGPGGERGGPGGEHRGPGAGKEPPPLPPAQNNPDEGF